MEISRGDRRKWEFNMRTNARAINRMIPVDIGGYPVNYGFVPQTVSYDGDPFDALVLGPPLPGGTHHGLLLSLLLGVNAVNHARRAGPNRSGDEKTAPAESRTNTDRILI